MQISSGLEKALADLPSGYRLVEGWGMVSGAYSRIVQPETVEQLQAVMRACQAEGVLMTLRGSGCSYGDASHTQAVEARQTLVLDLTRLNRILDFDRFAQGPDGKPAGYANVQGGVTFGQLWKHILPQGHWPRVVPGTMQPTLAGAASMNVHGKNNFRVGAMGANIRALDVVLPSGELRTLRPGDDLFRAVIGGMGLLGCITRLEMRTQPVNSGNVAVRGVSASSVGDMMETMSDHEDSAYYAVGWMDCFAKGKALGRGLVHLARHLDAGEDTEPDQTCAVSYQELPGSILGFPKNEVWRPLRILNRDLGMRNLNRLKHWMGKRETKKGEYLQSHAGFNFLLDFVPNWKFAYGRKHGTGLIQYQPFLPDDTAQGVFEELLRLCQERGFVSYLGVLKRHQPDDFLLTHALDGWSLAMDFKVTPKNRGRLWDLCDAMTQVVLKGGGRFYFAKDLVLGPGALRRAFDKESVEKFLEHKREVDPKNLMQSDLYRRVLEPYNAPVDLPLTNF
ncbi:MAG: decaprenylphospho-beta-D-ribofuranose 2-oxidase [Glaciecola sp.]|jgi:decaprenylphospho-beta-D-ribofuranose 2-oxidase